MQCPIVQTRYTHYRAQCAKNEAGVFVSKAELVYADTPGHRKDPTVGIGVEKNATITTSNREVMPGTRVRAPPIKMPTRIAAQIPW